MRLQELKDKWGTWMAVANELKMSQSGVTYWRKRGYIPYSSQLLIEKKTKGLFKAREEDAVKQTEE
jgi:hypothetical protein